MFVRKRDVRFFPFGHDYATSGDLPVQTFMYSCSDARGDSQAGVGAFLLLQVLWSSDLNYAWLVHKKLANEVFRQAPFFRPVRRRVMLVVVDACDVLCGECWCGY